MNRQDASSRKLGQVIREGIQKRLAWYVLFCGRLYKGKADCGLPNTPLSK